MIFLTITSFNQSSFCYRQIIKLNKIEIQQLRLGKMNVIFSLYGGIDFALLVPAEIIALREKKVNEEVSKI